MSKPSIALGLKCILKTNGMTFHGIFHCQDSLLIAQVYFAASDSDTVPLPEVTWF